uniref:Thioredoxin-like fold domain-containing protein n=1 Tax=Graphocephala atropunctata TaxID=36148 RepID=A0A1B6LZY4_9HEMI
MQEEAILEWVLDLSESTPDVIESVDRKTLQVLINDVEHLAVFFYDDKCESCEQILEELETIDDDTDKHGIQFVKSKDSKLASEIGIFSFPALVYYETGVPIMYDGNLKNEKKVLQWLVEQKSDGCFIIGLGGKNEVPNPSYEPYKCCPTTVKKGTKVAKMTPAKDEDKPRKSKSKADKEPPSKEKKSGRDKSSAVSTEKSSKGKKGLFGSGKYIWWW